MMFDYKKEYKEFYMPKGTPSIVRVPKMNYIAVRREAAIQMMKMENIKPGYRPSVWNCIYD